MTQMDAQDARIREIIGDDEASTFDDCIDKFRDHLTSSLQLPCDVTLCRSPKMTQVCPDKLTPLLGRRNAIQTDSVLVPATCLLKLGVRSCA